MNTIFSILFAIFVIAFFVTACTGYAMFTLLYFGLIMVFGVIFCPNHPIIKKGIDWTTKIMDR
jgi:hypothetical protein